MQRSSSNNHGNYVGQCTMLFNHNPFDDDEGYPISSSSVDCTLSLATPSSRQTEDKKINCHRRSGSFMSNLCWGRLKNPSSSAPTHKNNPRCSNSIINTSDGGDPLLARRCTNCGTTSTPLWRNGPRGPKSLCNACGIRYKKEERRATSTTATPPTIIEAQHMMSHHHQSWAHQSSPALTTEFSFIGDDSESDRSVPLLSWRLNVPDRASLVHDYTY